MTPAKDPGWRRAAGGIFVAMIPTKGARMATQAINGLLLMRQLWITFAVVVTAMWVPVLVLAAADSLEATVGGLVAALVVAAVGVSGQALAIRLAPAVLGASDEAVRASAQRSFLIRVGLAELGAMVGFAGFVISANPAVYLVGYVVTLVAMVSAAPTKAKLDSQQQDLAASGSDVHLLAALVEGGITR